MLACLQDEPVNSIVTRLINAHMTRYAYRWSTARKNGKKGVHLLTSHSDKATCCSYFSPVWNQSWVKKCSQSLGLVALHLLAGWDTHHCGLELSAARPSSPAPFSRAHNSITPFSTRRLVELCGEPWLANCIWDTGFVTEKHTCPEEPLGKAFNTQLLLLGDEHQRAKGLMRTKWSEAFPALKD